LIATWTGQVIRRCLDETNCKPQVRNSIMMHTGGSDLFGIGVLDDTYIVVDRTDFHEKIYECPLTSTDISMHDCEVFADKPQGTYWDPRNLLVDPIKRIVFVCDTTNSEVLAFSFDRNFIGPLAAFRGALQMPSSIAQRPGLYAPLSPSLLPSSLPKAGESINVTLVMMDAYNSTVPDAHSTNATDLALEVSATGFIPGTDIPATIAGEIM
jgi:hypothetical protein